MGPYYVIREIDFKLCCSSVLCIFSFILVISQFRAHIAEYVTDSGGMIDNIDLTIVHILFIYVIVILENQGV